jgi:hypothetical protein
MRYIKRITLSIAIVAGSLVGVALSPASPVQAASCTYLPGASFVSVRCSSLYPYSKVRAYGQCYQQGIKYGPWAGVGQTSTALCSTFFQTQGYLFG